MPNLTSKNMLFVYLTVRRAPSVCGFVRVLLHLIRLLDSSYCGNFSSSVQIIVFFCEWFQFLTRVAVFFCSCLLSLKRSCLRCFATAEYLFTVLSRRQISSLWSEIASSQTWIISLSLSIYIYIYLRSSFRIWFYGITTQSDSLSPLRWTQPLTPETNSASQPWGKTRGDA